MGKPNVIHREQMRGTEEGQRRALIHAEEILEAGNNIIKFIEYLKCARGRSSAGRRDQS